MNAFASRWKELPIAASLLILAVVAVVAAIYLMSFRQRESYLAGRNFRLLAVLARQTDGAINAHAHTRAAARGYATPSATRHLRVSDGTAWLDLEFEKEKQQRTREEDKQQRIEHDL